MTGQATRQMKLLVLPCQAGREYGCHVGSCALSGKLIATLPRRGAGVSWRTTEPLPWSATRRRRHRHRGSGLDAQLE